MIHALSGMGADHRLYPSPWETLPGFVAHSWPRYHGERSLAETALAVCEQHTIRDGDIVIGSSLGGMIACEVAKLRRLRGLILVGSATSKAEITPLLSLLLPLADVAPFRWLSVSAGHLPGELMQMFESADPEFLRAMCHSVRDWEGVPTPPAPLLRLHGRADLVIPPPAHVDLLLDCGHLIALTHARECVEFIRTHPFS